MTIVGAVPIFVAIAGAAVYLAASNAKVVQLALYAFACGLLVSLFSVADRIVHL